ncbi:MAG: alpha-mannosidase [Phycisphaerae bacterium]|nr:alpha-mannosidase [Phycisphaerae bacterium]
MHPIIRNRSMRRRNGIGSALLVWLTLMPAPAVGGENAAQLLSRNRPPQRDLATSDGQALYCVGYAHLDTQWRWDFSTTIDEYIRATLDDNFHLIDRYPEYTFNFTGSVRYEMMKEYYPERYARLKGYIEDGRWFVSGSSVDEGDVNVPSAESIVRQVLYGNLFFEREFGQTSVDYMLPDCFGFPASMPTIWAHCGLLGFSTQKLTWGSAVGIPFKVGVWEGPDGSGVIAALDPGPYVGAIEGPVHENPEWRERVARNGRDFGVWADYHYYGTGDQGGAPRESDVQNYLASATAANADLSVVLASSGQMFRDITPGLRVQLPRYQGDMLLTEHSAGTLTSQSYMKRWNRQAEQLADAAERAATCAWRLGAMAYPRERLERAWVRVLANQMHDILPGTSIPRAYRFSWNDDLVALNIFADILRYAVGRVAELLDTDVMGRPVVIYNPLAIDREDVVEVEVPRDGASFVRVYGPDGREVPSQLLSSDAVSLRVLFLGRAPANGFAVFDVRRADRPFDDENGPRISARSLENDRYRVTLNDAGDIAGIHDKLAGRELLAEPATLVFTRERPRHYPAWNMDWADRKTPPIGRVDGVAQWRIVESGPVRAALAVTRRARNSEFTQVFRLTRGDAGNVVEVAAEIDWQSTECALKAAFPLTVSNPEAVYNWGVGTIRRGNNEPVKYEVPSHEWFDLTDREGNYGVTVLEDSKFGSDKPEDNELRLTLLYTPGVRSSFLDQHSQDWGVHHVRYGLYGHEGDWRAAQSEWRGRRFNQPMRAFLVPKHSGRLGRTFSLLNVDTPRVDVRTVKRAERRDVLIVRLQELWGQPAEDVRLTFPFEVLRAEEVDGQERRLGPQPVSEGQLAFDLQPYELRAFAVELAPPGAPAQNVASVPVSLSLDTDVVSSDGNRADGAMDLSQHTYPAEQFPARIRHNDVVFELGPMGEGANQALTCRGQTITLGSAGGNRIHLLAAATEDATATFRVGDAAHLLDVQSWTGFVGQWWDRVFDREFGKVDYTCAGRVTALLPGFIKRDPIAWFSTHRHSPDRGNEAYRFTYLFHYELPRLDGATTLTLPFDERIRVFAVSVADDVPVSAAAPLYDELTGGRPIEIRHSYDEEKAAVFQGREPEGRVLRERARQFELLETGPPRNDDDIDASREKGYTFRVFAPDERDRPHPDSGVVGDHLVRLNDGLAAENNDDTKRCVWFDGPGRFTLDLLQSRPIASVTTYTWHRSNRAPQYYSLWGTDAEPMPDPGFGQGKSDAWSLIAVVDTRDLGDGQIHASRIVGDGRPLGPYRYLLWVAEDVGQGSFFTEIDIDFTETAP